jgi:urea transport system permease protein
MVLKLLVVLLGLAIPAQAAERDALIAGVCSDAFPEQLAALQGLAAAGAAGGPEAARWARAVVEAVDDRALRCDAGRAFIAREGGFIDATTLAAAAPADPAALAAPSVNLRLRATAASAAAALALLTEPDVAGRAAALAALDRRREALTPDILAAAVAAETDATLADGVAALRAALLLADPDPANRVAAIEAIAATADLRSRTAIAEALAAEADAGVIAAGERALAAIDRTLAVGNLLATLYSGASYASVLLLAALGLAIIFGLIGVINLAQGELIMVGAYAAWFTQQAIRAVAPALVDWYLVLAIPVSFAAAALVGLVMEALVIRRLYDRPLMTLLATWAISLLLINTVRVTIGTQNLEMHQPFYVSGGFPLVGDFILTANRLFAIAVAVAAFLGVIAVLRLTTFGLNVRAVTQNRAMAGAAGVDVRRTDRMAFALGSGLAGLAGVALAPLYNVNPNMGSGFIVDAFMVVVLGGVGSLAGAVVASLGIGQINVAIEPIYGAVAAKVIVLLLVILFIQRRPEGLFAPKGRR